MEYQTPQFFHVMEYAARADGDVVDMVSGNPDWEPPAALRDGLGTYADADADRFQYPPSEGLRGLREEIAAERGVDRSQVVVTNGTGEANYLAMARALERDAGNEVVLTDPVYPYYPGKAQLFDADISYVPTNRDGSLDLDAYRRAVSADTALVLINNPNNPTGAVYDPETVERLVALCEANDALLLSDEVYDRFDFSGRFESALAVDSDHRVVTSGFSKSFAITGFRVGYAIFPQHLVELAKTRHMLVNVAGARPSQRAVLAALREVDDDYYEGFRSTLRDRIDAFTDALADAGAEYATPEGSFYVMARFEGYPGTLKNVKQLIDEAGVAGMPGETFGTAREEWLRFALVTPRATEGAERLAEYFA